VEAPIIPTSDAGFIEPLHQIQRLRVMARFGSSEQPRPKEGFNSGDQGRYGRLIFLCGLPTKMSALDGKFDEIMYILIRAL
jgi:hypothetical protein